MGREVSESCTEFLCILSYHPGLYEDLRCFIRSPLCDMESSLKAVIPEVLTKWKGGQGTQRWMTHTELVSGTGQGKVDWVERKISQGNEGATETSVDAGPR